MTDKLNRRDFTRICGSMIASAATGAFATTSAFGADRKAFGKTQLLDSSKTPLTAASLPAGQAYIFFYPFVTTPCFLINLGESTKSGDDKQWRGGVGPDRSIVAYSAICSHKMSHPAKEISFINYRHDKTSFYDRSAGKTVERTGVISCCSERSVYDPRAGAKVLSGPAPQPLAAIEIEVDSDTDVLYATASYGGDMYDRFFEKFGFRAAMEHRVTDPKKRTGATTAVRKIEDYSSQTIKC